MKPSSEAGGMGSSTMHKPGRGARFAMPEVQPQPAVPPGLHQELVQLHRGTWLRDAEATLTVLDWRAYTDGRTLHVLDARAIGGPERGYFGFVAGAQLHELAADLLPRKYSTQPAAAVAVNVDALVPCLRLSPSTEANKGSAFDRIRAAVAAVAAHELAHVIDHQATGGRLPAGTTLEAVLHTLRDGTATATPNLAKSHGPSWVRAYCHLLTRASWLPRHEEWVSAFHRDIGAVMLPHPPGQYLDALHSELVRYTADDELVGILRTPAPAGFMALFD
jgi:uncharacterized protein (DUF2267 family)